MNSFRKLIWLPLEKLDQRYTVEWAEWFPAEFERLGIDYLTVEGDELTSSIEHGQVLDAHGTNYYKFTQLAKLIKLMHEGEVNSKDKLLFADIWYPGIEALQYIACLTNTRPKICGVLHAGTYDSSDFTYLHGMRPFGRPLEESWFSFVDELYVGSQYHRNMVLNNFSIPEEKIIVTGLPFRDVSYKFKDVEKQDSMVIFPHRLDPEKHPEMFDALKGSFPSMRFVKTKELNLKKTDYHAFLATANIVISFADHENFGYGMFEATNLGCIPLMPSKLSYAEYYPTEFLYKDPYDLVEKIKRLIVDSSYRMNMRHLVEMTKQEHLSTFDRAIKNMVTGKNLDIF